MVIATYPTISHTLPSAPYILSIHPPASSSSSHLILRHPSPNLTLVDNQTLQPVDELRNGHTGNVMAVFSDASSGGGGAVWSGGRDAAVVRWDERSRRAAGSIKAFVRKPLPVLALTASGNDHLVIAGTELVSSESHIIYWDTRAPNQPLFTHSSTHSDDITHLSLLPSTSSFLQKQQSSSSSSGTGPIPDRLLLSASTDGLVALTNVQESDEDEAVLCAENFGESLADAGWYLHEPTASNSGSKSKSSSGSNNKIKNKGKGSGSGIASALRVWGKSDMDAIGVWQVGLGGPGEAGAASEDAGGLQLADLETFPTDTFRFRTFPHPTSAASTAASTTRTAEQERADKDGSKINTDYLIGALPSLGASSGGMPMAAVGTNDGDIILLHHSAATGASTSAANPSYTPSGYFLTPPQAARGHKDVIRAIYHDTAHSALYTGSEDGVLCGWSLSSLSGRMKVGDKALDDLDEEDDRNGDDDDDDDDQSEESEIETDDEDEDGMDVDDDEGGGLSSRAARGPRQGPIIGLPDRRERKKERTKPY